MKVEQIKFPIMCMNCGKQIEDNTSLPIDEIIKCKKCNSTEFREIIKVWCCDINEYQYTYRYDDH